MLKSSGARPVPNLWRLLVRTGRRLWEAVTIWRAARWWGRAVIAGVLLLAWSYKMPLQKFVEGTATAGALWRVAEFIDRYADGFSMIALFSSALVIGHAARKKTLIACAEVFVSAGVWTFLFWSAGRFILAESRPMAGGELHFFAVDGHGISGHAAVAALLALPVRDVLLQNRSPRFRHAAAFALLGWAALVAWSRVWLGLHFVWNVLFGLALGFWVSAAAVAACRDPESR